MFSRRFLQCKDFDMALQIADNDFANAHFCQALQKYSKMTSLLAANHYDGINSDGKIYTSMIELLKLKINTATQVIKLNQQHVGYAENSDDEKTITSTRKSP